MRDRDLYATILGLTAPWKVTDVELDAKLEVVAVSVEAEGRSALVCPECGESRPGYDTRGRRWRHLDTCQYETILVAQVPRIKCAEHGVRQIQVPWDEVDGIMQRAVARCLARREPRDLVAIGVNETSFQKRHEYVTVVTDLLTSEVLHIANHRRKASLDEFYRAQPKEQLADLEIVAMDMS